MKATELMIGDWVTGKKWRENPFKLIRIRDNGKYFYGITSEGSQVGPFFLEELEPIPLTPEILEKNGWEKRPTGYVFYTDGKRYDNSLWYIFGSNTFVVNTAEFQIKYVHELQHALKLCGAKKEIVL